MKHLLLITIAAVRLLLCGMATGALVGLLLSVVVQIPLGNNPKNGSRHVSYEYCIVDPRRYPTGIRLFNSIRGKEIETL